MPERLLDKEMIEFHGEKDSDPVLMVRVLPEEQEFVCEEMKEVYKGIFVRERWFLRERSWSTRFTENGGIRPLPFPEAWSAESRR